MGGRVIKKLTSGPYLIWMLIFILLPVILIAYYSLTVDGVFSFANFERAFDPLYLKVLLRSFYLALKATLICLVLGYPMAMILANMTPKKRTLAVMLFVVPMWMNFLLRTYAWMTILGKNGVINSLLKFLGIGAQELLFSEGAVLVGMVYNFLPFMVLPIYTVLTKMDKSVIEAAQDLGGNKYTVFSKVVFPLSMPGVISGVSMVFMPSVSTFVISNLLYGGQYMLVGNLIEQQFMQTLDRNFGSAISMILMFIILITMTIMNRASGTEGEVNIW